MSRSRKPWNRVPIVGERFGRLVAIREIETKSGRRKAVFRCDCGVEKEIAVGHVRSGKVISCGCARRERIKEALTIHGGSGSLEYGIWSSMIGRCENPKDKEYKNYGARGIKVCDEWRRDFSRFTFDMGPRPDGMSIDRVDNDGNYESDNCRWATAEEQQKNKRNNIFLTHDGQTKHLGEWSRRLGIGKAVLWRRLKVLGWPIERVLSAPVRKQKPRAKMNLWRML